MRRDFVLPLLTVAHFCVDGVCGAALAAYAVDEPYLAPIVYYFGLYNLIAFGGQWCAGLFFDKQPRTILPALFVAAALLGGGLAPAFPVWIWVVSLGLGNCLFHAAAGSLVLRNFDGFSAPGIFVSSGAVGLGLGLGGFCPASAFFVVYVAAAIVAAKIACVSSELNIVVREGNAVPWKTSLFCAVLLLFCVVLRGFGGGGAGAPALLFPCAFMLGKAAGGVLCDHLGYRRTILAIFLLGFFALQGEGVFFTLLLTFAFNMTMPLTLRLLHRCAPAKPGMMFGLAAGCLLPGAFYPGAVFVPASAMVVLQFLCLWFAGYLLRRYYRMVEEAAA